MQMFDLSGHVAVVTGGSRGIGLGISRGLAQAGADLAIFGRNESDLMSAAEQLAPFGRRVVLVGCDVGDEGDVADAFDRVEAELGNVDSCFVNAGIAGSRTSSFTDMRAEEWYQVMRINLDGAMFTARAACRKMVARGLGGSLVFTASIGAFDGFPFNEHYAASKAAVVALAKGLAVEMARHQIRSNVIVPGLVRTDMTIDNEAYLDARLLPRVPLRRWGTPSDYAGIAVYLASAASSFHTGDVLVIDGGYLVY